MNKVIIFDWSGVISDDRQPVYEANMALLDLYKKKRVTFEEWLPNTKASAIEFLKFHNIKVIPHKAAEEYRNAFDYARASGIHPKVYSDTKKVVKELFSKDIKLIVISAHPSKNLEEEAREYGIYKFFDKFTGTVRDKTSTLLGIAKDFKNSKIFYVGDTIYDIQAARNAGVKSVAITNGYHIKEKLMTESPDFIIDSLSELLNLI